MAYEVMYEGDGFIRKGPTPKEIPGESGPAAERNQAQPARKPARRRGGITLFRFARLLFGH